MLKESDFDTRLTNRRTHPERDAVVARSGVRVSGRDEVYGAYEGVSESVPPSGGGALVVAALLRTVFPCICVSPPNFLVGQGVARNLGLIMYTSTGPNVLFLCTRPCLDELLLE
jgi:hypothetical protein